MTENILVPLDGSKQGYKGLKQALEDHHDDNITVFHSIPIRVADYPESVAVTTDEVREAAESRADDIFRRAYEIAEESVYDGELETMTAKGKPSREILAAAEDFDRIVIGSHGRDTPRQILLGSTAENVVRRASVPVLVVR